MGWQAVHATLYKPNGKIDIKAEIGRYYNEPTSWYEEINYKVLKASVINNICYAAIEKTNKVLHKKVVYAIVFVIHIDNNEYYNFAFKELGEFTNPHYYDCPISILKLLSPTNNELSLKWRELCRERFESKRQRR